MGCRLLLLVDVVIVVIAIFPTPIEMGLYNVRRYVCAVHYTSTEHSNKNFICYNSINSIFKR